MVQSVFEVKKMDASTMVFRNYSRNRKVTMIYISVVGKVSLFRVDKFVCNRDQNFQVHRRDETVITEFRSL